MPIEQPGARPSTDVRTGTYLYYRHTLPVRVMHATLQAEGDWHVGCRFVRPLSGRDLEALLDEN